MFSSFWPNSVHMDCWLFWAISNVLYYLQNDQWIWTSSHNVTYECDVMHANKHWPGKMSETTREGTINVSIQVRPTVAITGLRRHDGEMRDSFQQGINWLIKTAAVLLVWKFKASPVQDVLLRELQYILLLQCVVKIWIIAHLSLQRCYRKGRPDGEHLWTYIFKIATVGPNHQQLDDFNCNLIWPEHLLPSFVCPYRAFDPIAFPFAHLYKWQI